VPALRVLRAAARSSAALRSAAQHSFTRRAARAG
jgi:hypothetical protein